MNKAGLKIVYCQATGNVRYIRNEGGLICSFPHISKWEGQEDRYKKEVRKQHEIAELILNTLKDNE